MKLLDDDFEKVVTYIFDNYGIDLRRKRLLIEGRLAFIVTSKGFTNFSDYIEYILDNKNTDDYNLFIDRLTTNHSYFMREMEHFNFFMKQFLPQIEKTNKNKEIRIWSAGCSYGQEPYTLAMYINEYFGDKKELWDTKILATDISSRALISAKEGIFQLKDINDIPANWLSKYFTKTDDNKYKISPELRKEVIFKYFNLTEEFPYKKPFDIILCRNVMIYFTNPVRDELISKFYNVTKPGGYLFIGHAENLANNKDYKYIMPAIYRK